MKFALWMAWTLASDSDAPGALNFRQHPEWFTRVPAFDKEGGINLECIDLYRLWPRAPFGEQAPRNGSQKTIRSII